MDAGMIITGIALAVVVVAAIMVVPPVRTLIRQKTEAKDYELLMNLTETGVRWAKQWMQTSTGEEKKEEVFRFVSEKAAALGLRVDEEDIDKAIEAVYEMVKKEM